MKKYIASPYTAHISTAISNLGHIIGSAFIRYRKYRLRRFLFLRADRQGFYLFCPCIVLVDVQ